MFDPEKVERFTDEGDSLSVFPHSDPHFVLSSDYDQLLEEFCREVNRDFNQRMQKRAPTKP